MGTKCPVCDGPIINGRCKFCGMPYRKDELLYHLNENRSEHYKHASAKVQREMRREQIPLPDRKKAAAGNYATGKRAAGTTVGNYTTGKRAAGTTSGNYTTGNPAGRSMTAGFGRTAPHKSQMEKQTKKKADSGTGKMWITIVTTTALLVFSFLPDLVEFAKDQFRMNIVQEIREILPGTDSNIDTKDLLLLAVIDLEDCSSVKVGEENSIYSLVPGKYVLENQGGNSAVAHYKADGTQVKEYKLRGALDQQILELKKGDVLSMRSTDNKYNYLLLYLIEQYDE